jgi:ubiquitin carboxyl-terminal hydrolase 9/24
VLEAVLNLLRRDVSEYGRHLVQYFGFFVTYANLGDVEKTHLLNVIVVESYLEY